MERMKISGILDCGVFILSAVMLCSCSGTEKTEAITAEITAAQMEGRDAAKYIVSQEWPDTAKLQIQLLEAKAKQSRYLRENKPQCAEAFDTAFIRTIRTVNPALANSIKK